MKNSYQVDWPLFISIIIRWFRSCNYEVLWGRLGQGLQLAHRWAGSNIFIFFHVSCMQIFLLCFTSSSISFMIWCQCSFHRLYRKLARAKATYYSHMTAIRRRIWSVYTPLWFVCYIMFYFFFFLSPHATSILKLLVVRHTFIESISISEPDANPPTRRWYEHNNGNFDRIICILLHLYNGFIYFLTPMHLECFDTCHDAIIYSPHLSNNMFSPQISYIWYP